MAQTIAGGVIIALAAGMLVYAIAGRIWGFHRARQWEGGGETTLVAELAVAGFLLSGGLVLLLDSGVWGIPAFAAWIVGYVSQSRANRRHREREQRLRAANAAKHPGIFENPPPEDFAATVEDEFDVYDAGACTFLGTVRRPDVQLLIDTFEIAEHGSNDIPLIADSLEHLPHRDDNQEFIALLERALEERDFLVVRWMPPQRSRALTSC